MARLTLDISMSLDGFIAGPNRTVEEPLGDGGELADCLLHGGEEVEPALEHPPPVRLQRLRASRELVNQRCP